MQAVSVAERGNPKPSRFSSLKAKEASVDQQESILALPLTNMVINKDLMQANSVSQMLSGKTLLEREEMVSYHRNAPIVSGTHQGQTIVGPESRNNSTQNLSVKKQLQQKVNTVEGFIMGVEENSSSKKLEDGGNRAAGVVEPTIPSVSLRPVVKKETSEMRIINSTDRYHENQEELVNLQQIKVLATAKKTVAIMEHNYDMNTPEGVGLLDTAMKPVRLGSGYSEDITPTAHQQMMKPRNILSTGGVDDHMTVIQADQQHRQQPQLKVITSHFQPKIQTIGSAGGAEKSSASKVRQQDESSPGVISQEQNIGEDSEFLLLRQVGNQNQDSTVLMSKRDQISSRQQLVGTPKSFKAGLSGSFKKTSKPLKSAAQSIHSQTKRSGSPNRGFYTAAALRNSGKDDASDNNEREDLWTQLQITQIKPQTLESRSPGRGVNASKSQQAAGTKRNTSRPVSDYKQSMISDQRRIFKEDHPLIKLKTQAKIADHSGEDSLVKVRPLRSPATSNRRLLSNDGKSSSNSNRNIMQSKIDSSHDSVFQQFRVQKIDAAEQMRDKFETKRTSTVLVHKLQNQDMRSEINSALLREEEKKLGNTIEIKKTELMSMERDLDRSIGSQAHDGQTPKRKSVLARKSNQSTVVSNNKIKEIKLQKSHIQTLQGTIASQDHQGQVVNDVHISDEKSQEQQKRQNTVPSINNELPALDEADDFQRDKKNISAITLKRESSEEIHKSDSRVLMSRVASIENHDQVGTMRDQNFIDPYANQTLDTITKKKAFSAEYSDNNAITEALASPDGNKQISNDMLLQIDGTQGERKRLTDKEERSSQRLMVTSLGEESFIHPPSPIHQNDMMNRPLYDSSQRVGDIRSGSESHQAENQLASKGGKQGIPSISMFQKNSDGGINAIVVDVMHAGVDAQDFNDLSDNETNQHQDLIMIDRHSDLIIGQFGDGLKSAQQSSDTALQQQQQPSSGHGDYGGGKQSHMQVTQPANQMKLLRAGQAVPTVSCLCKELELTPEQFAYVVQQYKRQPRVIMKSETQPNKVLLVGEDGTSKDASVMENILQGTIKVDGLSISRMVKKNMDYFLSLEKNAQSPHRQRERRIQFDITRKGSDQFTSSRHTIDNINMNQQLAQFMQYGQDADTYNNLPSGSRSKTNTMKSHLHSHVKHTNCADGKHVISEPDGGYNTPLLLSSQFLEQPSKMDSSHNNQQMFGTYQIDSSNRDDHVNISLSPKTAYASKPLQESYRGQQVIGVPQKSSDFEASTGRQYYQTDNHTLKPKNTELLQSSFANSELAQEFAQTQDEELIDDQTHQNSVDEADAPPNNESLVELVPTKVQIIRPQQKRAQQVVAALQNDPRNIKFQVVNDQVTAAAAAGPQQIKDTVIRMEEQFYLDNHLARSSDMSNEMESGGRFLGYIVESQEKKRVITPFLGKRYKESDYGNMVKTVADTRNLQPGKHFSALSNVNKKSTLSKEYDVSTQWRQSNEASRYGGVDENSVDEGSLIDNEQVINKERRNRQLTTNSRMISRANSMQQRGKKVIRKPSQIGALTAACRLTPNKIEFKIKPGNKNKEKEEKEKELLMREISVMQSKRGMIADISRTFSSALSHKTNILRATSGLIRGTKVVTRSGITMVKKGQNENLMPKGEPAFIFSKGRPRVNSNERQQTQQTGEDNSTIMADQAGVTRNPSLLQQTNQSQIRHVASRNDFSSDKKTKLNQDLTMTQQAPPQASGNGLNTWIGFNETRRMTANHVVHNKRDKLIDIKRERENTQQMGETASQMFLPAKDVDSNQFSNMFLPGQTGLLQERLGTAYTSNMLPIGDISLLNQTNYVSHFKRAAGEPIVRITKSSEQQTRDKISQKSASLLRGNQRNKMGRMASQKRKQDRKVPQSGLSIEKMIQELGNQESMVNTKLIDLVQRRADFRPLNNRTDATQPATQDYIDALSDVELSSQGHMMRPNKTTSNFFTAAQLQQLDKSTVGNTAGMSQYGGETTNSTADRYSSHAMLKINNDPNKTQISWNRNRGSLLPSNNQSKGDMIPMEPIQSLMTDRDDYPSIKNHRTQVQSQNLQKRRLLSNKATEIYYAMRQQPGANFDLAKQRSTQFSQLNHQSSYNAFRTRHNSKETPLELFYQTTKGFENLVDIERPRSKYTRQ